MFQLTETVAIGRPAAEVWAVLVDFPYVPAWERDVLEVRQASPGSRGVGTTLVARRVTRAVKRLSSVGSSTGRTVAP